MIYIYIYLINVYIYIVLYHDVCSVAEVALDKQLNWYAAMFAKCLHEGGLGCMERVLTYSCLLDFVFDTESGGEAKRKRRRMGSGGVQGFSPLPNTMGPGIEPSFVNIVFGRSIHRFFALKNNCFHFPAFVFI